MSSPKPNPKVSVIVPIFNTAKYLPACLDSIISQTYQNLEIILVDDGSTDDSPKIIRQYAKKDPRIKTFHQPNSGQSAARNQGLRLATGAFISFVDSDDAIQPTFIKALLQHSTTGTALAMTGISYQRLSQRTKKDVYIAPVRRRAKHETFKSYALYLLTRDGRLYSVINKLFQADIATQCHFDESLNFAEDTKFVLDYLAKFKNPQLSFVPQALYAYHSGTETSTMKSASVQWPNWQTSYQNLKTWLGPHPTCTEKFYLHLVHLRWRISYIRSKRRAKQAKIC